MKTPITAASALTTLFSRTIATPSHWQPTAGTLFQIQLSAPLQAPYITPDTNPPISVLDGDLFDNSNNSNWATIKSTTAYKTLCYFSAGSFETWRPDAGDFLPADKGEPLDGWPGEYWLDTNSENVRAIMGRRMDLAVKQGCDGIDPDNIDAYENGGGGFNLTQADAVEYVQWLAGQGHQRGLAVGLKNGGGIVGEVVTEVDFEVNEQCLQYEECEVFRPFIDAGKPVFEIEYTKDDHEQPGADSAVVRRICTAPSRDGFSTVLKHMSLDEWVVVCGNSTTDQTSSSGSNSSSAGNNSSSSNGSSSDNNAGSGAAAAAAATVSLASSVSVLALGATLWMLFC